MRAWLVEVVMSGLVLGMSWGVAQAIEWVPVQVPAPPPVDGTTPADSLEAPTENTLGLANLARNPRAMASASSALAGYPIHQISHLNDGRLGNDASWVSGGEPSWAQIDLGEAYWVCEVAIGNDESGRYTDRGMRQWAIQVSKDGTQWLKVAPKGDDPAPVLRRSVFRFAPVQARFVSIEIGGNTGDAARLDEIEVYGRLEPITVEEIGFVEDVTSDIVTGSDDVGRAAIATAVDAQRMEMAWERAVIDEEYAWLKAYGRADLDAGLVNTPYPKRKFPAHVGDDTTTLVHSTLVPILDGDVAEDEWATASTGVVTVAVPTDDFQTGALVECTGRLAICDVDGTAFLYGAIETNRWLSSHLATIQTDTASGVLVRRVTDSAESTKTELVLRDYAKSQEGMLREVVLDAEFGKIARNGEIWQTVEFRIPIAETGVPGAANGVRLGLGIGGRYTAAEGRPVTFLPGVIAVTKCGNEYNTKNKTFTYRVTNTAMSPVVMAYSNGSFFEEIRLFSGVTQKLCVAANDGPIGPELFSGLVLKTSVGPEITLHPFCYSPVQRTWNLYAELVQRGNFVATTEGMAGADGAENTQIERMAKLSELREIYDIPGNDREKFREIRQLKRDLFLARRDAEPIGKILFEKRYPLEPSHNYSDYFDSTWREGGGIYTATIPSVNGVFRPDRAMVTPLFQTTGMSRHPALSYDATTVYFTNRKSRDEFWDLMAVRTDGTGLRRLTDGPFQDLWPTPLPDGGLAMVSTRCTQKFLCWRPQASVLYRIDAAELNRTLAGETATIDPTTMKPLSFANLTEWAPSVTRDGRILWTRSEYQDKGADYGHTLWTIRPDGTMPELAFGNTMPLPQGFANGREIPGTDLLSAIMISHFGDLNGPVAIIDRSQGRFSPEAISTITPEVPWPGFWAKCETFREPYPISDDLLLVSHASRSQFGIFLMDRHGNRELLYTDTETPIGSMCPIPLRATPVPPVVTGTIDEELAARRSEQGNELGEFFVENVYAGLDLPPGIKAKYIRVCQEVRHTLDRNDDGTYRSDHEPFMEFYASPVDLVSGPYGWTSYVAKASWGIAEVSEDGSARFTAPAGKVLYFELLDENYNEIQRMRSVIQLQPGEQRSCVGCHEDRTRTPLSLTRSSGAETVVDLAAEPWGIGAFDYQKVVQPVLDRKCTECHNSGSPTDLSGTKDADRIPASYKTLIRGGFVHHFDWQWQGGVPTKAAPLSFGTVKSRLWPILTDGNHRTVDLTSEETRAINCWTDLSCPLWPDYQQRRLREE